MTDTANFAFVLMTLFFALLALTTVATLCGLPAMLRAFDAYIAKSNTLN